MAKAATMMVHRMGLTEARNNLGQIAKRAHNNNEVFVLEKDGIPVAALMSVDDLEDYLELSDPEVQAHIKKSHQDYQAGRVRPAMAIVEELRGTAARSVKSRGKASKRA